MSANLNENFRKYSRENADFTHLKIIRLFVEHSLLAAM